MGLFTISNAILFNTIQSFLDDKCAPVCYDDTGGDGMRWEYNLQTPNFTVGNIDILKVSRGKDYRHSYRNGRTKYGFIYVVQGEMQDDFLSDPTQSVRLETGDLIFIPKACVYEGVYLQEDTQIRIVQFDLVSGELPQYLTQPVKIGLPNAGEVIDAFFRPAQNHVFYHMSCLYSLLWQIDDFLSKMPAKYKRLQPALTRMAQHWQENEKISLYAGLCGMSEVNFRRLFRAYTGRAPIDYRNDIRLQNARIFLQSGEYNVSEAAENSGFSNLSFFIRLYKKKYGTTPKKT